MAIRKIDFPDHTDPSFDPTEEFEAPNGITYSWNGYGWEVSCGFEDPTCDLDRKWETAAWVSGIGMDLAEGVVGLTDTSFVFKGNQLAYIEVGDAFTAGTETYTVTDVQIITEATSGDFTEVTVDKNPFDLIGYVNDLEIEGLCEPIGKRYLLAHGDNVQDCDDIVKYQWNHDVEVTIKDDNYWTFKNTQDFVQLEGMDDDDINLNAELHNVDITASSVNVTARYQVKLTSENRDVTLEAAADQAEKVEREIDDTSDPKQITNKEYVDALTDQLHQDVISLDEEIESIAKSMEKGFWRYGESGAEHVTPQEGRFFLLKNYIPGTGGLGAAFTQQYTEAEAVVFNNKEWNPDSADGSGGANHTWADVAVGELIDLLDKPDPDFLFGKITHVDTSHHSEGVIIAFDKIEFDGSPTNNAPFQSLLKIFKEPTGGTASEFVKKIGDTMSGSLKIGDVSTMPDNVSTDSPKLYFANKNTSNAGKTPYLYSKSNTTTIYSSNALRSGAAISANGNLQYNGITRVGMDGNGGYLSKGTSESDRPLEWNDSGIFKLWGYNGQGTSGQVLKLDSSLRPYWGTVSTSGNYVKTPSADANAGIEIYRSGNSYYIQGGAS